MERRPHLGGRALLAAALLFGPAVVCSVAADADRSAETELIHDNLVAAGIEGPDALYHHRTSVLRALDEVERRVGRGEPTYPRARKLHQLLHKRYLRDYLPGADGVWLIPEHGRFNCLSASIFYGLAARRLGFEVTLLHDPGHLLLQLSSGGRIAVVETTLRDGFDRPRPDRLAPGHDGAPDLLPPTAGRLAAASGRAEFPLETTVGFSWLNRAWRALERGETTRSADYVLRAGSRLPELERVAGARGLLTRAFGVEYEAGRFDAAYHVATIEIRLFPSMTTSRDRLLAVAVKRVEDEADSDEPAAAEGIIGEVRQLCSEGADLARFERRTWPIVTASAVRSAEWERARRAARAYAAIEPDPVEADQLVSWVESRHPDPGTARLAP